MNNNLYCFNPITGKRDGGYCAWEGGGKCLSCAAADRIAELKAERDKLKKALHSITNMAHPLHMEIFNEAMKGLGLEDVAKQMEESNATLEASDG
jgi:hypothetical protein